MLMYYELPMRLCLVLMLFFILGGCLKKDKENVVKLLFTGECSVEVVSQTAGAKILIDGIHVGEASVKVNIPCGEKSISVQKYGYIPYEQYLPTTRTEPLKVTVKLEPIKKLPNLALSRDVIIKARGPLDVQYAKAATGSKKSTSGDGSSAAVGNYPDTVEFWR